MATVITYLAGLIYTRWVVWRVSSITVNWHIGLHFLAALAMGQVLSSLYQFYPVGRWFELAGLGLLGLGIYLGIFYLLQEFTKEDINLLMDTLNVKKMGKYIKKELKGK